MPVIEIEIEEDLRGPLNYEIIFRMTVDETPPYFDHIIGGDPGSGAEFVFDKVINISSGTKVSHGEFDAVTEVAYGDHYSDLLAAAREEKEHHD